MEKKQTSRESAKQRLQEQAEEAKAGEEAARREEEEKKKRKKKLQERAALVFLSYTKEAREEEAARRSREEMLKRQHELLLQYIGEEARKTEELLQGLQQHDESVGQFFDDFEKNEPEETRAARGELLKSLDMDKKAFHTIALSSALENPEHREEAEKVLCGKPCSDELRANALRREALQSSDKILSAFRDGDARELKKLLTDHLKTGCREFAQAPDPVVALHWARHIGNIVSILERKALLEKEGKDAKLIEAAVGITAMGRVMESGYEAMLKLQKSALAGESLPEQETALLGAQILLMQQVDEKRNSPSYQAVFAGKGKAEKRTPEENMKRVLDQLSRSSILQQLSSLSPAEACFAFSDPESRSYLAHEQFSEKPVKPERTEPQQELGVPAAHF